MKVENSKTLCKIGILSRGPQNGKKLFALHDRRSLSAEKLVNVLVGPDFSRRDNRRKKCSVLDPFGFYLAYR